jgi:hypothetical protein
VIATELEESALAIARDLEMRGLTESLLGRPQ